MSTEATSDLGWRQPILARFTPEVADFARLTIVADPDSLLAEERVVEEIRRRGFDLIPFEDPVAFRYAYESLYRHIWDRGEPTHLVVVLRTPSQEVANLPYDLLDDARRSSRVLSFGLVELFPNLAPHVVASLDRADLDALYRAQQMHEPGKMGENATKDFVLRHVFEVAPELVKTSADLLGVLLRRHYKGRQVPAILDERLLQLLGPSDRFRDWPLRELLAARDAFFRFLQERWPMFLRTLAPVAEAGEIREPAGLRYQGPVLLPFDSPDVRVYVDNLFLEGLLEPVVSDLEPAPRGWVRAGIKVESENERAGRRLRKLTAALGDEIPGEDAAYREWIDFAFRWAAWLTLRFRPEVEGSLLESPCEKLHDQVEAAYRSWMCARYSSLHNLSYLPKPVMVHQIPAYLDHVRRKLLAGGNSRLALIVVDGLALDQWVILRGFLRGYRLDEGGAFAWVPTLTQVTRQSIFAGEAPLLFARTIAGTFAEKSHWSRVWVDRGLKAEEIFYVAPQGKKEETGEYQAVVLEAAEHPKCRMLGAVIGTIDQNMHQTDMGTGWMHSMVRKWAQGGGLQAILERLFELGFEVFLTADHGNIWGRGIGKPKVGAAAKQRGERAHIFKSELIRASVHGQFPGSLEWPQHGLPSDFWALIAPDRACFRKKGQAAVSHGGIALEEVVVPFIHVRGRS